MQNVLSENTPDTLTNMVWERWKKDGIHNRYMTWLELHRLAEHFLKICKDRDRDYREYDFFTLIDSNLNYYENLSELDNHIGAPKTTEKEHFEKLKDYFTEEKLSEFSATERSKIEEIEQKHQTLNQKLNKIAKQIDATENQTYDTEQLRTEIQQIKNMETNIMAKIESLPNLDQQIEAMLKSPKFKDLGNALKPFTENKPEKPPQLKRHFKIPAWLKPKQQIKPLDAFAGAMTTLIYLATSGWILSSFTVSWSLIAGLAGLWLSYVVVFRLVVGGLLD